MSINLIPASNYTIEELTAVYNDTRMDYIVPMPMNTAKMHEYIHLYDVNLDESIVAYEKDKLMGLGMLGIRDACNCSWITRLGLVATSRGKGIGSKLMEGMLSNTDSLGIKHNVLEVIIGNDPAHGLFKKFGFEDERELLILRRAPSPVDEPTTTTREMGRGEAIYYLKRREGFQAWTNQTESLARAKGVTGFNIETPDGGFGWLIFQRTLFNLSRLMFETSGGDPVEIMLELLRHLHHTYPNVDTYTENIPTKSRYLPAFTQMGYIEAFRRIEMHRYTKS